jgi:hypothetical protein
VFLPEQDALLIKGPGRAEKQLLNSPRSGRANTLRRVEQVAEQTTTDGNHF